MEFWANAFVPTTTRALRVALEQCSTLGGDVPYNMGANEAAFEKLVAINSRANGLALSMVNRSDASDQDREFAITVQKLIEGRVSAYKRAESRQWWTIVLVPLLLFGGVGVSMLWNSCASHKQPAKATNFDEKPAAAPISMLAGFEGRYRLDNHPGSDYLFVKGNSVSCAGGGCKDAKWGNATCTVAKAEVHPALKDVLLIKEAVCVVGEDPSCTDKSCRFDGCSGTIKRDVNTAKLSCGATPIIDDSWIYWKAD